MDFSLNEEQRGWQMEARRFAEEEIRPLSLARDQIADPKATFDWEIIKNGSKLGFRTLAVPKEWGGHEADFVTQALVMAELARGDSSVSKTFSQCWKWSHLIAASCTKDQKERFLKPFMADDSFVLGKGGTEANAGSDNRMPPENDPKAGWRLRAEQDGDYWVLNGTKIFISHAHEAEWGVVFVRTDPSKGRKGISCFIIDKDTPGFTARPFRTIRTVSLPNEVHFEDCKIPAENMIGNEGDGLGLCLDLLTRQRFPYSACNLGVSVAAHRMAIAHAKQRSTPLNAIQTP